MPLIQIGDQPFDVEVVVFDKDGTLIDFHIMWGRRATTAVDAILDQLGYDAQLEQSLYETLGYNRRQGETAGNGPLAIVPLPKIDTVMATVLYQYGLAWDKAEQLIRDTFSPVMSSDPTEQSVKPLGNVHESIQRLNTHGIRTALATSDNRTPTLKMLEMLNIDHHFDVIYCGDDDELPQKPSAQVLEQIAMRCSVDIGKIMMVSDTVSDLSMAHAAKAGGKVGVMGGATEADQLSAWSDALITTIDELEVQE